MIYRQLINYWLITTTLFIVPMHLFGQELDPKVKVGKALFNEKCASCHNGNMKSKSTGPPLGLEDYGVKFWLKNESREDLYKWIRNSRAMVDAGNARAVAIYNEYGGSIMTAFPKLKDEELESLVAYIIAKADNKLGNATAQATGGIASETNAEATGMNRTWLWVLFSILVLVVVLLGRYINNLNRLAQHKTGGATVSEKSVVEILFNRGVIRALTFFGLLFGGYWLVNGAIGLGRQQGYAPDQPVKFSHKLHAGNLKIDCQYCHDGARRSKHAVIPATNTCMNCHKAVKIAGKHNENPRTGEIMKIYASAGFNPIDNYYFSDTDSLEMRRLIYQKWAEATMMEKYGDKYKASEEKYKKEIQQEVEIATQYIKTVNGKTQGKPIEWIRIHNLQDHAYFNHAQHVVAGKIACQTCHGEVENMELMKQHAPLSMGWCVNCHRQTEVQFDNEYYEHYHHYKAEKKVGQRKGVTVEDVGGLECQKCHY